MLSLDTGCGVMGVAGAFCFWLASQTEDALNIATFGAAYEEYVRKVPGWNLFKGLGKLRKE